MNNKIIHKIISLWTIVFLLLPIGVQFAHAIENHEHQICDAQDVQHIHKHELDCSFYHVKLNTDSIVYITNFTFTKPIIDNRVSILFVSNTKNISLYYKSTRGPPQFIV